MRVKVSLLRCGGYEYENVRGVLNKSLENLGGLGRYVRPGERVLLKPNLLTRKKPEDAVTTHPVFVKALASLLIEHGASVIIGESPGGPFSAAMLNGVYITTGMEAVAAETGAALNANYKTCERENPKGLIMKRLLLTDMLNDADKVISVAKLKTHGMMTYTGAVKNMFGVVPGTTKAEYHLNVPGYDTFADALIDICLCAEPVLSFIDGITGMEGNGPASGTAVSTGIVLASESPYHLDQTACRLIGLKDADIPVLRRLTARGIIRPDMSDIEYTGEKPGAFNIKPFITPPTHGANDVSNAGIPKFIKRFLTGHVQTRPVFDAALCTGCGICGENCPSKVITVAGKASAAYRECIRCYCCQELCPQKAVGIKRPILSKLMRV